MQVKQAMTRDVTVANPDETIQEAARLMAEIDAGSLPVGENNRLVGMITDRDIAVRAVAADKGPQTKVRDVMSKVVRYCFEDEDIVEVIRKIGYEEVRRVPVVDRDNRLVGILSLTDAASRKADVTTARALHDIVRPGGRHNQARA